MRLHVGHPHLGAGQLRWLANLLISDVPERFPSLKFVSVESGIGWLPFLLEALDYQFGETAPEHLAHLSMKPSEYFKRQFYGCFWFESKMLGPSIEELGASQVMFETDFPHPTCLYPNVQEYVAEVTQGWSETRRRKILQDNAAALYKIDLP